MNKVGYLVCFSLVILQSCKGSKNIAGSYLKKIKASKVILNHYDNAFDFKTFHAKVKVKYDDGKQSFNPNVSIRMEKGKKIWVSAKMLGITLAKVLIVPEKVSYYEKIDHTYFEGDFKLLSNWLGIDLDFNKVEQLLLGQALFDLRDQEYVVSLKNEHYQLQPKKELHLLESLILINPNNFKVYSQQLQQPIQNKNLQINYRSYQRVGDQDFPKEIYIEASEASNKTSIKIDYRAVDYNASVSFPFKIPSGYKQVIIK